jgi:IS30 family transposase
MSVYTQLTQGQRYQMEALLKAGHSQTKIATILSAHKSTVSRELRRNQGLRGYRPKQAHVKAMQRRYEKPKTHIPLTTWVMVDALIKQDWSPEQISGRLYDEQGISISHEWIYLHIYKDKHQGGELHKHLRCQKQRRKSYGKQDRRGRILNRVSIEERPAIVNSKSRIGDWEGDTIIGKGHQGVVTTHVERKSKYTVLTKSNTKHANLVRQSIVQGLKPYQNQINTITYDNGLEFSEHQNIAQTLSANIYFAHPYSSWERGLNENTNGLIRQYLPKSQPLNNVTQKELNYIMDQLNHRPRKTLGFKTPYEQFFKKNTSLTVALHT